MKNLILATSFALAFLPSLSRGDVSLMFVPDSSTTISPGQSVVFDVDLVVTNSANVAGVDYSLEAPSSGQFTLSSFSMGNGVSVSPFSDLGPGNVNGTPLNPTTADLGASLPSGYVGNGTTGNVGNGTYLLSHVTVQASSGLSSGTYDLSVSSTDYFYYSDSLIHEGAFSSPAASLDISVVPEPSTWAYLLLGFIPLLWWGRRMQKTHAVVCPRV